MQSRIYIVVEILGQPGFTDGEISPSEGYLCKPQKRAAGSAQRFCYEMRNEILKQQGSCIYFSKSTVNK